MDSEYLAIKKSIRASFDLDSPKLKQTATQLSDSSPSPYANYRIKHQAAPKAVTAEPTNNPNAAADTLSTQVKKPLPAASAVKVSKKSKKNLDELNLFQSVVGYIPRLFNEFRAYPRIMMGMMAATLGLFAVGLFVTFNTESSNNATAKEISSLVSDVSAASNSGSLVDSNSSNISFSPISVNNMASYTVASDEPRYLEIPSLNVVARILQSGLTTTGQLVTPKDVYDATWYKTSAKPGQTGATVITGLAGPDISEGSFYNLDLLSPGETIVIVKGDGSDIKYKVVKSESYKQGDIDLNQAVSPVDQTVSGLNLVTSDGGYSTNSSNQTIVFAEQED